MRVLLVEDNRDLAAMVADHLRRAGFVVDHTPGGVEAQHMLAISTYQAMVLDLGLADGDGLNLLTALRRGGQNAGIPVIILTARDGVESKVTGLNAGADDYVVKPFSLTELEARLRAVLRRPGARQSILLQFGDLLFEPAAMSVRVSGVTLDLARKEYALLEEMIRAAPGVVIKDSIEDRLYSLDEPVTPNAVEAIVSRLRKKLAGTPTSVRIETLRGLGYRLTLGGTNAPDQ
ncbi:response regulator transcription factor [Rhodobacter sp. 24-YEA-8]|uniref:response regulator transcription factor n=1 Tax=Rhodobacter sp. 24-YEA-8 TaxID=1884310 RepID=UPI000897BB52|nr:response regulator transcription factor [Rhodobacter sp. 24-YEA-8]SED60271.1 DNA-binding response regulator, OmpR family, contains REC and winged-helix (wHTH) domain [Rhodobacter sp. 24-YEA-8]